MKYRYLLLVTILHYSSGACHLDSISQSGHAPHPTDNTKCDS